MNKSSRVGGAAAAFLLLAQLGCGGRAQSEDQAGGGTDSGGAASAAGVTGSAGLTAVAGGGSGSIEGRPLYFDDSFPWFDASGQSSFPYGARDEILHVALAQAPARGTLSTHNVYDALSGVVQVRFAARASVPFRLLVSAGHDMQVYDYFAARAAGAQWPVAGVDVDTEWQTFDVPLAAMEPPETIVADRASFYLAFIVDHPQPVELWLDEVHFK